MRSGALGRAGLLLTAKAARQADLDGNGPARDVDIKVTGGSPSRKGRVHAVDGIRATLGRHQQRQLHVANPAGIDDHRTAVNRHLQL